VSDWEMGPPSLDPASIEAVARRVIELLGEEAPFPSGLIDAAEVARRLGVAHSTVYEKAAELGAIRLGDGPRARLRFDPRLVERMLDRSGAALVAARPNRGERAGGDGRGGGRAVPTSCPSGERGRDERHGGGGWADVSAREQDPSPRVRWEGMPRQATGAVIERRGPKGRPSRSASVPTADATT
jgi:hypothetical protein